MIIQDQIKRLMALWFHNIVTEREVITWADCCIAQIPHPPYLLLELSAHGPKHCASLPENEFPPCEDLPFLQVFALKVAKLDLLSDQSCCQFADWLARTAIGEDLNLPEVQIGYYVDHCLSDCKNVGLAILYLRKALPPLIPGSIATATAIKGPVGL